MIKTFRGMIADGAQDTIVLHTNDGTIGYRILKFQSITNDPTAVAAESVLKIFKVSQTTITDKIDFSDNTLLGVSMFTVSTSHSDPEDMIVIFDKEVFNQDIFITHSNSSGSDPVNYYLELEQVKLGLSESTVATLKDIRNVKTQGF